MREALLCTGKMSHRIWASICPLRELEGKYLHLSGYHLLDVYLRVREASLFQVQLRKSHRQHEVPANWPLECSSAWGTPANYPSSSLAGPQAVADLGTMIFGPVACLVSEGLIPSIWAAMITACWRLWL